MKILVACEFSGIVRDAFILCGHNAWSCDILPTEGNPKYHIKGRVEQYLDIDWDLVIAHPPCTDLSVSGARWFKKKIENGDQQRSIDFFMNFTKLTCKWCIENPIGIMSTIYRKPDQIIQPWQFGHPETKKTCLWLNNLPLLFPTKIVKPEYVVTEDGKRYSPTHYYSNNNKRDRSKIRSRFYHGIASAMAEQWG